MIGLPLILAGSIASGIACTQMPKEKQACGYAWDIIKKCICMEPDGRYSDDELIEVLNDYMRR